MKLTLWRAAVTEEPWLGYGSFWTPVRSVAYDFMTCMASSEGQQLMAQLQDDRRGKRMRVYRAQVDWQTAEIADLRPPGDFILPVDPKRVQSLAGRYAEKGFRMVLFHERVLLPQLHLRSGSFWQQGIYLGSEPLSAVPEDSFAQP